MSRSIGPAALAALLVATASSPAAAVHPWLARRPPKDPPPAHQLSDTKRWPAEPPVPAEIDPVRFRKSVAHLCSRIAEPSAPTPAPAAAGTAAAVAASAATASEALELGDLVLTAARDNGLDPFLLAGLMYEQSSCRAKLEAPLGYGLLRIHPSLYRSPGAPPPPGDAESWRTRALLDPAANLKLGAQLLKMWQDMHQELDEDFGGVPHRGPAAHFIWGDVVRSSGGEDLALTARRRLLAHYNATPEPTVATSLGLTLICPLEGTPRVATSGPGEDRAGGRRRHRGIDLTGTIGEPVRAVADGRVMFAGANLPGRPRRTISPSQIHRFRWRTLGAGGIYVCIEHAPERHIVSCYMHLDRYTVAEGDMVTAGQELGRVGRTGVRLSPPHLHFELRVDDRFVDPARYLTGLVIPPKATQTYRYVMKAKRTRVANKARNARAARPETQQKL